MNKELNELIEMLKADIENYQQCKLGAIKYDSCESLITYYSSMIMYINSLITRIEKGSKQND